MGLSVFDSPPLKEDIMKYKVTLNGKTYEIEVEAGKAMCLAEYEAFAPAAAPAPKAAAPAGAEGATKIAAPMPGTVVAVKVAPGQAVKANDVICVLEAMKMENDIVAPADGVVATVCAKGTAVNSGDTLATLN